MAWHPATIVRIIAPIAVLACGGGGKPPAKPTPEPPVVDVKKPPPAPETEEDREKRRHGDALAIIPKDSTCLPPALKNTNALRLELAAIDKAAVVCAIDQDRTRLLGAVGCWTVQLLGAHTGELTYQSPAPLPGRGLTVMLDDRCARGFCLPKDAEVPQDPVAMMAWNLDGSKVAVLVGDTMHIYDAASRAHEASFSIRGDKGVASEPTAIHWNGAAIFVQATDGTSAPVYVFKQDGAPMGALEALGGGKDRAALSTRHGSFVLLNETRVGISEQGFSSLTTYEIDTGKRAKLVRKVPPSPCKKDELEALWRDPAAAASTRCKDYVSRNYAHLMGADMVAGSKNFLALLRGPRLGELAVIDSKTLAELKTIKMPWCDAGGSADKASSAEQAPEAAPAARARDEKVEKPAAKKAKGKADDPDAGGQ